MSENADYLYALELQKRLNTEEEEDSSEIEEVDFKPPPPSKKPLQIKRSNPRSNLDEDYLNRTQNLVHPMWETLDPTPDIFSLFGAFDSKFFQSRLKCVTLEWSKRMYSCAGICYSRRNRFGMDVTIRLSEPLLKLRPRKDLVETMLHEMIHAYCFVLHIREGNGGHGPNFKKIMYGINQVAGTNITVYHTFHDEVDIYKQHWWRCNGSCQNRSPFFGYVKRTCNRAPSHNDQWWAAHQETCGGTFMKIKEPEKPKRSKATKTKENNVPAGGDLRKFFPTSATKKENNTGSGKHASSTNSSSNITGFGGSAGSFKGPVKSNGGGTMLLNPKTARSSNSNTSTKATTGISAIAKAFPPTSYPGLSTDPFNMGGAATPPTAAGRSQSGASVPAGGNLRNVKSLRDLNSSQSGSPGHATPNNAMLGRGFALDSSVKTVATGPVKSDTGDTVNREHLREIWSKRFGVGAGSGDGTNAVSGPDKVGSAAVHNGDLDSGHDKIKSGDTKRRRLSTEVIKQPGQAKNNWVQWDDDIMWKDQQNEIIALSSNDESDDSGGESAPPPRRRQPLTADERQNAIKQEIMDEAIDLDDKEDIILIDDEYDDNQDVLDISAAVELADTSLIDEFFGEDTLLKDFKRENDVRPTGSRYVSNPSDDIITCPICQGKMKRSVFAEHLNGCTGIAVRIAPPKHALKNLATTSREAKPTRRPRASRSSMKEILRNAGYTEQDLINITSTSSAEEEEFLNSSGLLSSSKRQSSANCSTVSVESEDENTRNYRQRNILKTTRQCPVCAQEVEEDEMNEHLDECLKNRSR